MIGNDIIDLLLAKTQSNWQRPGFLDKQFTSKEIELIRKSEIPFLFVWRLWSMKEAVYKVVVQQEQKRFFAPKKFVCEILSETQGSVSFQHQTFQTQTHITDKYIYTSTGKSDGECIGMKISQEKIVEEIERQTGFLATELEVKKTTLGIPNLFYRGQQVSTSFTKTHHGDFQAIAYKVVRGSL